MKYTLLSQKFLQGQTIDCSLNNPNFLLTLGNLDALISFCIHSHNDEDDLRETILKQYIVFLGYSGEDKRPPNLSDMKFNFVGEYSDTFSRFINTLIDEYNNIQSDWDQEDAWPPRLDLTKSNKMYLQGLDTLHKNLQRFFEEISTGK